MRHLSCSALALTLAAISVNAISQEVTNNDMANPRTAIDQTPVTVGDVGPAGAGAVLPRARINNTLTTSTDTLTGTRAPTVGKEVFQQQVVMGPIGAKPPAVSEFQKFVTESLGKALPVFGSEFFANAPSTFAPVQNVPVPDEYPLGPGDEVLIRAWGNVDIDFRAIVDRNGTITIPTIGTVVLSGVKAGEASGVIRQAIGKLYKDVNLSVNFGQLRAITIYVVGQASRPGTYTVSSLSTLVTALFASGGPNANGSMRKVQVKRAGKVVAELDLYEFIAKGDKSADIKLLDGDTIYIPAAIGYAALTGKVNSPAIYELRSNRDTIQSILDYAGGLPVVADPRRAFLERIDPSKSQPRSVEEFPLSADGLKRQLKNGDVLNVTSITPDFSNAVILRGNVDQPIRAAFKPGMRVRDLIPSREYLINRASTLRQNAALGKDIKDGAEDIGTRIGGLIDEVNWEYAVVERTNRTDLSVKLMPFNLAKIFESPTGSDNIELQPGDTVTIFSQKDVMVPIDRRRVFVRVDGEVNVPGVYQMSPGENLHTLIARAGGPTSNAYLFGTAFYREQVRKEQEANLAKVVARLENQLRADQLREGSRGMTATDLQILDAQRTAETVSAREAIGRVKMLKPTGRISFGLAPEERSFNRLPQLKLENGDALVVPARPDFVHVFGAVNVEVSLLWRPGLTVSKYLKASGVTADADLDNIFVMRVDGSVVGEDSGKWFANNITGLELMPGDTVVVPQKVYRESAWNKFTVGLREWSQILANFGLSAAAIRTLK